MLTMAPALIGAASGSQSTAQTVSSLLPLVSPLLSGILSSNGGSSNPSRVPNPPRRPAKPTQPPTTTTTQSTTTTTEVPDPRPECPGTCIAPYLAFTCFGNAETTEIFKCKKSKTICCSPKSAVKEENDKLQRANFPPLRPGGPPGTPQLLSPVRRNFTRGEPGNVIIGGNGGGGGGRPIQPNVETELYDPYSPARYPDFEDYDPYNQVPVPTVKPVRERPPLTYPVTNKYVCGVKGTYRYAFDEVLSYLNPLLYLTQRLYTR